LCEISAERSVDFAKTSAGFASGGATLEDLKPMRAHLPPGVRIKAAGGERTLGLPLEAEPGPGPVG
jgi:deoxyribose-phosphate aldolase